MLDLSPELLWDVAVEGMLLVGTITVFLAFIAVIRIVHGVNDDDRE